MAENFSNPKKEADIHISRSREIPNTVGGHALKSLFRDLSTPFPPSQSPGFTLSLVKIPRIISCHIFLFS